MQYKTDDKHSHNFRLSVHGNIRLQIESKLSGVPLKPNAS